MDNFLSIGSAQWVPLPVRADLALIMLETCEPPLAREIEAQPTSRPTT